MTAWGELRFNIARFRQRHGGSTATTSLDPVIEFDTTVGAVGLTITTARVPDGEPIEVRGRITAGIGEFDARASIRTRWIGECRRCLEMVEGEVAIDATATFTDGDIGDAADVYAIDGDWLDVGEAVREEVMLALPLTPLCSGDCAGADPARFPMSGIEEEREVADSRDPRWAVLTELTFDED